MTTSPLPVDDSSLPSPPDAIALDVIVAGLVAMGYAEVEPRGTQRVFSRQLSSGRSSVLFDATDILWTDHPRLEGAWPVTDNVRRLLRQAGAAALSKKAA
jgi:hypothetical protein